MRNMLLRFLPKWLIGGFLTPCFISWGDIYGGFSWIQRLDGVVCENGFKIKIAPKEYRSWGINSTITATKNEIEITWEWLPCQYPGFYCRGVEIGDQFRVPFSEIPNHRNLLVAYNQLIYFINREIAESKKQALGGLG